MLHEKTNTCYYILPRFGKQKLLTYAESLEELSHHYVSAKDGQPSIRQTHINRNELIVNQKMTENTDIISKQLKEISKLLKQLAGEAYVTSPIMEKQKRRILKILNENGLDVKDIYAVENKNGYLEVGITMCTYYREEFFETADIAKFLSKLLHNKMTPAMHMPAYVKDEEVTIVFREEVRYFVTNAVAKATKEGESFSGDNYTMTELNYGTYLAAISDGMGSGICANKDSLMVIELLEQFMEVGFDALVAAGMVNDLLLVKQMQPRTATLDIMNLNLYSGACQFVKIGAAATFIKRGDNVYTIISQSLPLGLFPKFKEEVECEEFMLLSGDIIVMVSDGIIDSMGYGEAGEELLTFLAEYEFISAQDLANHILSRAIMEGNGEIKDDMTVLVMEIEEK